MNHQWAKPSEFRIPLSQVFLGLFCIFVAPWIVGLILWIYWTRVLPFLPYAWGLVTKQTRKASANVTITDLRNEISDCPVATLAYHRKQFHRVPDAPSVIRETFLLERCKGKVVLDIGASGKMHEAIVEVAAKCHGIDRPGLSDVTGVVGLDLDDYHGELPEYPDVEVVVCGEVIEHLSNPGWFLDRLRKAYPGVPVIITTPNAFSDGGRKILERGVECVNLEHRFYFSYWTLKALVESAGFKINEWAWYKGRPRFSEGIIFVVR